MEIEGRRIFVAGHRGMVGSAVMRRLADEPCQVITADRQTLDLRDAGAVDRWMGEQRPDLVIMAAARVGGILANDTRPVEFLHDNLAIAMNTIRSAHASGVEKLVFLGSSCVYPKFAEQPIREDALLTGPLEPTNQWYAIAKIAGIKLCEAFRAEHGADFVSVMPCNLYGINDNFDLAGSHVLPALLRKAHEARVRADRELVVWGTGTPLREFLYVDDLADALLFVTRHYSAAELINAGSGEEVSIRELAELICDVVGFQGELTFDRSKPDGTPRKVMDSSKLFDLGWRPATPLRRGIERLYDWYLANHA